MIRCSRRDFGTILRMNSRTRQNFLGGMKVSPCYEVHIDDTFPDGKILAQDRETYDWHQDILKRHERADA